ncbi:MAG: hypothetical protein AB7I30_02655 [Isosphaeraceae bacterium]
MRRPKMALAKVFLGIGIGTALPVPLVSAQQPPALLGDGSVPGASGAATTSPSPVPPLVSSPAELTLPSLNPSRGARHLLRNGWDYVTYQQYDRALAFFREAEARQNELNNSERTKLKQGIERAQRGIRELSSGIKTEPAYARSGRSPVPGAIAAAAPRRDPIQLAGGDVPAENSANVRASGDAATEPATFEPTSPAPDQLPMTPDVAEVVLPTVPDVGSVSLPPFSSIGHEDAPVPVGGPEPAPVPADAPAPAPEPEPLAPASGEVSLPDTPPAPAPEPEPQPSPDPGLELPPIPVVEQLPPLPSGMGEDTPVPVITPIPAEEPPVVALPGVSAAESSPFEAPMEVDPPPADPAPESPLDLPRRSATPVSSLSPALQREVEEIARRQEDALRQNPTQTSPGGDPDLSFEAGEYGPGGSTRLEISRAPSPTEARPIRAIPVPEEFVPLPKRDWHPNRKYWAAAATCHMPLYFQDAVLERYGYSMEQRFGPTGRFLSYPIDDPKQSKQRNQLIQPFFSAGLFAAQIVALPYNLIVDPPWEAEYDLGYYRPGDRVPTDVYYLPKTGVGPIGGYYGDGHHPKSGHAAVPTPRW